MHAWGWPQWVVAGYLIFGLGADIARVARNDPSKFSFNINLCAGLIVATLFFVTIIALFVGGFF